MKKIILTLILSISLNLLAQDRIEFIYSGQEVISHQLNFSGYITKYKEELVWTTCYRNNIPYACQKKIKVPYQKWKTINANIVLNFDQIHSDDGLGTYFELSIENESISLREKSGKTILSLGKITKFEKSENGSNINITSEMLVTFRNNSEHNIFLPVRYQISNISEEDKFLKIRVGKIVESSFFKLILKISKKKFWGTGEVLINRKILPNEMEISMYGDNRSLITIDLEYLLDYISAGDKYVIEVMTRMNMGEHIILSERYKKFRKKKQYRSATLTF